MNYSFSFQTAFLPPPFSYGYTLSLRIEAERLAVDFEIEYTDREDFSPEMIAEEGAEISDFFEWKGHLGSEWKREFIEILKSIDLSEEQPENQNFLYFSSDEKEGFVTNTEEIQYFLQELIQAIYEVCGKERPLQIQFVNKSQANSETIDIQALFKSREFQCNNEKMKWEGLNLLLAYFENFEFEEVYTEKPNKTGIWVTYGDSEFVKIKSLQEENNADKIFGMLLEKIEHLEG